MRSLQIERSFSGKSGTPELGKVQKFASHVTDSPWTYRLLKLMMSFMEKSKADTLKALGLLIRQHRVSIGISQEELGLRCDLDRTYISGLERGVRNPSLTALLALANGLNLTVSQLLENLEVEIRGMK